MVWNMRGAGVCLETRRLRGGDARIVARACAPRGARTGAPSRGPLGGAAEWMRHAAPAPGPKAVTA